MTSEEDLEGLFKIIDLSLLTALYEEGAISFPEYIEERTKIIKPKVTLLKWIKNGN